MRRPSMRAGSGITVWVGSGNGGWVLYEPRLRGRAMSEQLTTQKPPCQQLAHSSSPKRSA